MSKDPFAIDDGDDRTVLQPRGGFSSQPQPNYQAQRSDSSETPLVGEINELERAASRLLPLVITLKSSSAVADTKKLRARLIDEIELFKQRALKILGDPNKVTQASYVMCTVLDEAAMNTPWGHQSNWAQYNLLASFHNEVIGGERFFKLLKSLGREPSENIELLELMYVCLSLGYEGRYRIEPNGQDTLIKVRQWLYEIIQSVRGSQSDKLSSHWTGTAIKERKLPRLTPLWVMSAGVLTIASILFLTLSISLGNQTEDVTKAIWDVEVPDLAVNEIALPAVPSILMTESNQEALTLSELLDSEIQSGNVDIEDSYLTGNIVLRGANLFASGSNVMNEEHFGTVEEIAFALDKFEGDVVVTGHSDNIPIRSGKWASNLELSEARAESVRALLAQSLHNPERVSAVGRGSLKPIADNSTREGRSMNRRVEVTLFY